jgi:hypothetical protein
MEHDTLILSNDTDKKLESGLFLRTPSPDQLTMNGEMEGHKARLQRKLLNLDKFLFVSATLHLVQEVPFNR